MEGGPKIKKNWSCSSPQTPPSGQIFTWSYSTCKCLPRTKFQLPSSNSFRDKEGVPKFNVETTTPLPWPVYTRKLLCVSKYLASWNRQPNFSIVPICIMHSASCAFGAVAPRVWNDLPADIVFCTITGHFQAALEDSSAWTIVRLTTDLVTCPWSFERQDKYCR